MTHLNQRPAYFLEDFFLEDFFFGTLPPSFRASDKPIAIACFLLVTFLPDLPLFNVPSLRSCIAFLTFFCAFLPYLAIAHLPPIYYSSLDTWMGSPSGWVPVPAQAPGLASRSEMGLVTVSGLKPASES